VFPEVAVATGAALAPAGLSDKINAAAAAVTAAAPTATAGPGIRAGLAAGTGAAFQPNKALTIFAELATLAAIAMPPFADVGAIIYTPPARWFTFTDDRTFTFPAPTTATTPVDDRTFTFTDDRTFTFPANPKDYT
jgi:hypothetical protein